MTTGHFTINSGTLKIQNTILSVVEVKKFSVIPLIKMKISGTDFSLIIWKEKEQSFSSKNSI